jgi:chorismate dehydratase
MVDHAQEPPPEPLPSPAASAAPAATAVAEPDDRVRLGVVSFVNTLPLIDGLDACRDLAVRPSVPSLLLDRLLDGTADLALCSSIDYQRSPVPMVILPVGRLGCDGPTLTVRLYSRQPIPEIDVVHCDTDSHTSVALLRIILREQFGIDPELVPYHAREKVADARPLAWPDAMLLIGDKVVTDSPPAVRYPHQLDLGAAWHELTGLPFTFAAWMARADVDPARLDLAAAVLDRQRRRNRPLLDGLIHDRVVPRGWPADLAREYLGERLRYHWDPAAEAGLERYWALAGTHGLIPEVRPLRRHAEPRGWFGGRAVGESG